MPPQDGASIGNPNLELKNRKLLVWNWLSEGISELVFSKNVGNIEKTLGNMITNKMNIEGNVFHSRIKYQIDQQMGGTNIFTVNGWFVR